MEQIKLPELYPEKQKILEKIIEHLEKDTIGYINVPTGYGKTFISTHLMLKYLREGKKVLFIASRNKALLRQTYYKDEDKEIILFPNSICLTSDFPMSKWNEKKIISNIKKNEIRLVFASLQTILSKKKIALSDFFTRYFDIVIIDEIHNFIKNQGNDYIKKIIENDEKCHLFGMTATPFQGIAGNIKYVKDITTEMKEVHHKTVSQCILDGQLSPLNYYIVRNPVDIDVIFNLGEKLKGLNAKDLIMNGNNLEDIIRRTKLAQKIYDEKIDISTKTLVFCAPIRGITQSIEEGSKKVSSFHAKLTAALFNDEITDKFNPNISLRNRDENNEFKHAVYLSSDLKNQEIKEIIIAFKTIDKPPHVLCTVGMLVEGFNFPLLKNLILLRPTLSMRLFAQEIGRVLRKHEKKDVGNIFEIVDNVDIDTLYKKFGESILSTKRLKRLLMINPEVRLERLLLKDKMDEKAFEHELIKIKEGSLNKDIETIDFSSPRFSDYLTEISRRFPPIDFRVKLIIKLIDKINLIKKGNFQKELLLLMEVCSDIRLISLDDVKDAIKLIDIAEQIRDDNYDDLDLTQALLQKKVELFNEFLGFYKLKILIEIEKMSEINEESLEEIANLLGYSNVKLRMDNLKEQTLLESKGLTLKKFMEQLQIYIGVLTGDLEKRLSKDIEKGLISLKNPMFNKRVAQANVFWAETYYHDELDYLYNEYEEYYKQDEIKISF